MYHNSKKFKKITARDISGGVYNKDELNHFDISQKSFLGCPRGAPIFKNVEFDDVLNLHTFGFSNLCLMEHDTMQGYQ